MICLDSDFIIHFLRGDENTKNKLNDLLARSIQIATTSINALEIYVGVVGIEGLAGYRVKKTIDFLDNLSVLPLDGKSAERSAYILNTLKKSGSPIGLKDTLIAGIILENNTQILTRNIKHFELVPGLKIETW